MSLELRDPAAVVKPIADEMRELVVDIIKSTESGKALPDVNAYLPRAVDAAEWMRVMRDYSRVQGSVYLPAVIKKLAESAALDGDVSSARLLMDYLDVMPGKQGSGGVTVATQINISPQEAEEIKRDLGG